MVRRAFANGVSDDQKSGVAAWFAVCILLLLTILSYIDRAIISLMVDPIKRDLQIDDVQISLLQGLAFALFYAAASVPMGWLSDRISRRWVIFAGASVWSLATAACGLARSFGQLFVARFAVGAGEATLSPAAYALVADLFPPRRLATAIGVLAAGSSIGGAVALIVGGYVVSWAEVSRPIAGLRSWQFVFVVVGLPGLLVAPLVFLIRPGRQTTTGTVAAPSVPPPNYGRWLTGQLGYLLPLSIGVGCQASVAYGLTAWTPAYFQRHFAIEVETIGLTLGLVQGAAGIVGFVGGGWLVDRLTAMGVRNAHSTFLIVNSLLTTIIGVIAFTLLQSPASVLIALGFLHLLMPFTGVAVSQLQMRTPREYRARTVAVFLLIFNVIGMVVGPSSVAIFTERVFGGPAHVGSGIAMSFAVVGPLAVLFVALALRGLRRLPPIDSDESRRAISPLADPAVVVSPAG